MTNEQIEDVARAMCVALGLDPDKRVLCEAWEDDTPAERAARKSPVRPAVSFSKPQWRLYRCKAAEAIAAHEALRANEGRAK